MPGTLKKTQVNITVTLEQVSETTGVIKSHPQRSMIAKVSSNLLNSCDNIFSMNHSRCTWAAKENSLQAYTETIWLYTFLSSLLQL